MSSEVPHWLTQGQSAAVWSGDLGAGDGVLAGPRSRREVELSAAARAALEGVTRRTTVAAGADRPAGSGRGAVGSDRPPARGRPDRRANVGGPGSSGRAGRGAGSSAV